MNEIFENSKLAQVPADRTVVVFPNYKIAECGAAVFARRAGDVTLLGLDDEQTKHGDFSTLLPKTIQRLVILGTYTLDGHAPLRVVLENDESLTAVVYCNGPPPAICAKFEASNRLLCVDGTTIKQGPCAFIHAYVTSDLFGLKAGIQFTKFCHAWKTVPNWMAIAAMIDDRDLRNGNEEADDFMAGMLYAYPRRASFVETFMPLIDYEPIQQASTIVADGAKCNNMQTQVAYDRARIFGGLRKTITGHTAAVVFGTECTAATHRALHAHFQDAELTVVVGCKFSGESDQAIYSIQSWVPHISAERVAAGLGGGGSYTMAGARCQIPWNLPF
jgi:hypothetical protein